MVHQIETAKRAMFTVVATALVAYAFVILSTYTPNDPSWSHLSSDMGQVSNMGGDVGAWFADILYSFLGWSAWWLVVMVGYETVSLWWYRQQIPLMLRLCGYSLLILASSGLLSIVPVLMSLIGSGQATNLQPVNVQTLFATQQYGGILGLEVAYRLANLLTLLGAAAFLLVFVLMTITFAFTIHWRALLSSVFGISLLNNHKQQLPSLALQENASVSQTTYGTQNTDYGSDSDTIGGGSIRQQNQQDSTTHPANLKTLAQKALKSTPLAEATQNSPLFAHISAVSSTDTADSVPFENETLSDDLPFEGKATEAHPQPAIGALDPKFNDMLDEFLLTSGLGESILSLQSEDQTQNLVQEQASIQPAAQPALQPTAKPALRPTAQSTTQPSKVAPTNMNRVPVQKPRATPAPTIQQAATPRPEAITGAGMDIDPALELKAKPQRAINSTESIVADSGAQHDIAQHNSIGSIDNIAGYDDIAKLTEQAVSAVVPAKKENPIAPTFELAKEATTDAQITEIETLARPVVQPLAKASTVVPLSEPTQLTPSTNERMVSEKSTIETTNTDPAITTIEIVPATAPVTDIVEDTFSEVDDAINNQFDDFINSQVDDSLTQADDAIQKIDAAPIATAPTMRFSIPEGDANKIEDMMPDVAEDEPLDAAEDASFSLPEITDDAAFSTKSRAMQTAKYREKLSPIPPLSILDKPDPDRKPNYTEEELVQLSELLEIKLQDFNVKAEVRNAVPGPVVTRFEVELAAGVKASKVTGISRDLARSLSMASLRVVEVIPGKPYIGIEVPNKKREMVRLIELLETEQYRDPKAQISMAMGKDIGGRPIITDLARAPHMLVAGTTGSGKSVLVNAMLLSILLKYKPTELRLILIDPKQLELANYNDIPHLLTPVVTDMNEAASSLSWCVAEMERRYQLMSLLKVRKLGEFNKKILAAEKAGNPMIDPLWRPNDSVSVSQAPKLKPLPMIVIVADEFADMIMQVGKQAEELITRLAQKSRAAGIHLMLATQRPSVDVITGLIKANIPVRAALRVNSKVDSRTILDAGGAEDMLGNGDMLFLGPGQIEPERVHGAYVSDEEVNSVCDAWRLRGAPDYIVNMASNFELESPSSSGNSSGEDDNLYDDAVAFVLETRKVSASSIQRKFSIGYNRAARIVDSMEEAGLVSAMGKSGKRELLM